MPSAGGVLRQRGAQRNWNFQEKEGGDRGPDVTNCSIRTDLAEIVRSMSALGGAGGDGLPASAPPEPLGDAPRGTVCY